MESYLELNFYLKVNFEELVAQTEVVRRRHEERAGRQRTVLQQKIQEVKQEIKGEIAVTISPLLPAIRMYLW